MKNKIKIVLKHKNYDVIYYNVSKTNNDIDVDIICPLLNSYITYNSMHKYLETITIQIYLNDTFIQQSNLGEFIQKLKLKHKSIMTSLYNYAINNETISVDIKELFNNKLSFK